MLEFARRLYGVVFTVVFRRMDPERAHAVAAGVIRAIGAFAPLRILVTRFCAPAPELETAALGKIYPTPFGVAAGFDKNATMVDGLTALGFGHVEVGTVTPKAQPGNPRPRLFRLVEDRALINRMGFNNDGVSSMLAALLGRRDRDGRVGVNLGKNKITDAAHAADDYAQGAAVLGPYADYLVVNVSSPNTPGLRGLQDVEALEPILVATRQAAPGVPLLVKIAPDLDDEAITQIAALVTRLGLDGVVATNTTIARDPLATSPRIVEGYGAGGLSGRPLAERSLEVLRLLRSVLPEEVCIIAVGGVTTAADVADRLAAGATLVQGYTAFLYEGPLWAAQINRGLVRLRRGPR